MEGAHAYSIVGWLQADIRRRELAPTEGADTRGAAIFIRAILTEPGPPPGGGSAKSLLEAPWIAHDLVLPPHDFDLEAALADSISHRTKPGDLWLLGDHRLLCGDATSASDVERLLAGQRPQMSFNGPPYHVSLGDHGGQQRDSPRRRIKNDALPPKEWDVFCRGWIASLVANVEGAIYVCMSSKEWPLMSRLLDEAGASWSDTIIWAKDRFVLGRANYHRQYEPIWYGTPPGGKRYWCGDRSQSDLWMIPRPSRSELHPTTKPLEPVERAISNSSRAADLVLDLFLGSGTTLIACERTGRTCNGLELDPLYVDVAVARWESFTGEQAQRA